jgi:hypothetical protein
MKKLLLCIILLFSMTVLPAGAQEPVETWYFGWDNETGNLVAYNLVGGNAPLLTIDPDIQPNGWRLAPDRGLALLSVNGVMGLYQLSPQGATALTAEPAAEALLGLPLIIKDYQAPYVVLVAQESAYGAGILVDLENNTAQALSGEVFSPMDTWRFNADGTLLRYLSRETRESDIWSLWERTLASGDELKLYELTSGFPIIQGDAGGDSWLYRVLEPETRVLTYTLIFADGTAQELASEVIPEAIEVIPVYQYFEDNLIVYSAPCAADCSIEERPIAGGTPQTFPIAKITVPQLLPIRQVSPTRLLVFIENTYWLLEAGQPATSLGQFSAVQMAPMNNSISSYAPLLLTIENDQLTLWNLETATAVWQGAANTFNQVFYGPGGAVVMQFGSDPVATFYRASDSQVVELPPSEFGQYFEPLADGTVLYFQGREGDGRPAGIYRFNPADGAYILIVQNLFPLFLQPIPQG